MLFVVLLLVNSSKSDAVGSSNTGLNDDDEKIYRLASQKLLKICLSTNDDDVEAVDKLLKKYGNNVNINIQDPNSGQTALMGSVLRGKANIVRRLLQAGADPTISEKDGYTPPHGAAFQGRTDVMKVLKEYGIVGNNNIVDESSLFHEDGYLPFHRACWGRTDRHTELVQYMIENDLITNIDVKDKKYGLSCREMTKNSNTIKILNKYSNNDNDDDDDDDEF